jgi:hypothetical protein
MMPAEGDAVNSGIHQPPTANSGGIVVFVEVAHE